MHNLMHWVLSRHLPCLWFFLCLCLCFGGVGGRAGGKRGKMGDLLRESGGRGGEDDGWASRDKPFTDIDDVSLHQAKLQRPSCPCMLSHSVAARWAGIRERSPSPGTAGRTWWVVPHNALFLSLSLVRLNSRASMRGCMGSTVVAVATLTGSVRDYNTTQHSTPSSSSGRAYSQMQGWHQDAYAQHPRLPWDWRLLPTVQQWPPTQPPALPA